MLTTKMNLSCRKNPEYSIIIFRSVLGVTDTNFSNVLLSDSLQLFSVDENSIGKFDAVEVLQHTPVQRMLRELKSGAAALGSKLENFLPSWFYCEDEKKQIVEDMTIMLKHFVFSQRTIDRVTKNVDDIIIKFDKFSAFISPSSFLLCKIDETC